MINDHRTAGRDCFLHCGAASFANEQMAFVKHAREFVRPPENHRVAIACRLFNRRAQPVGATDGHRKIDAKTGKPPHKLRCAAGRGMDHVENAAPGIIAGREGAILREISKFGIDGKSECFDFLRRNATRAYDSCTLLIGREEIVGIAAVPNSIHSN